MRFDHAKIAMLNARAKRRTGTADHNSVLAR